ncbi:MAG: hypothetical protein WAV67_12815 [Dokdonella sp.]
MTPPDPPVTLRPLLQPFPTPGRWLEHAYYRLHIAEHGSPAERAAIGDPNTLERPWLPDTCTDPRTRAELWEWLDAVAIWINAQYTWDPADLIPTCWPEHPHLVRELAVIADQCRAARAAITSVALEEWHRYTLPMFTDRVRRRTRQHCDTRHVSTPGHGPQQRHISNGATSRQAAYRSDIATLDSSEVMSSSRSRLVVVDTGTGLIEEER